MLLIFFPSHPPEEKNNDNFIFFTDSSSYIFPVTTGLAATGVLAIVAVIFIVTITRAICHRVKRNKKRYYIQRSWHMTSHNIIAVAVAAGGLVHTSAFS